MTCPICGEKTIITNSRPHEDNTYRRRECVSCGQRFSTIEIDTDYYKKYLKGTVRNETESCT